MKLNFKNVFGLVGIVAFSFAVFSFVSVNKIEAAPVVDRTASVSGNWNDTATWGGESVPISTHNVVINPSIVVTVTTDAEVANINAELESIININSGVTLTASDNVTMDSSTLNVDDGNLIIDNIMIGGGFVNINSGNMTTTSIQVDAFLGGTLTSSGASTINIGQDLSSGGTLITNGTGTINFNGSTAQTMGAYTTYNNVMITNTSGGVSLGGTATIGGNLLVDEGTLSVGGNIFTVTGNTTIADGGVLTFPVPAPTAKTFTGNVTIDSGGTWNGTAGPGVIFGGNLENNGTFSASSGAVTFNGTSKTISGSNTISIPNIIISGTITNNHASIAATSSLTGSGTLTNGTTGSFGIGNTATITEIDATTVGNTVAYYKAGAQTVYDTNYHNLYLGGVPGFSSGTKTIESGLTITNVLKIDSGVVAGLIGSSTAGALAFGTPLAVQSAGTWGATISGATNINDVYFSGAGTLLVTGPTTTVTIDSISADTGTSSSDFITSTAAQTISATLSESLYSGQILYGSVDGGSTYSTITDKVSGTAISWTSATLSGTSSITIKVSDGENDGTVATQAYILDTTAPSTPIETPTAGTFTSAQSVTLESSGSTSIYYTTDGSTPTCSTGTLYSGAISVSSTTTINAKGCDDAGNISDVGTFAYTINISTSYGSSGSYINRLIFPATPQFVTSSIVLCPQGDLFSSMTGKACTEFITLSIVLCPEEDLFSSTTGNACTQFYIPVQTIPTIVTDKYIFTRNLTLGTTGEDVLALQIYLNTHGFVLAQTGAGSPGNETNYFGPRTRAALARFQAANGINPPAGFFGPITRGYINSL